MRRRFLALWARVRTAIRRWWWRLRGKPVDEAGLGPQEPARLLPDAEPVLDEGLIALGRFVARYYGASLGEALAAMVPRGIRKRGSGRLRLRARLAPGDEVEPSEVPPTAPQARVLRVLAEHAERGVLLADLCRMASVSDSPVKTLARHGRITLSREREDALVAAAAEVTSAENHAPAMPSANSCASTSACLPMPGAGSAQSVSVSVSVSMHSMRSTTAPEGMSRPMAICHQISSEYTS